MKIFWDRLIAAIRRGCRALSRLTDAIAQFQKRHRALYEALSILFVVLLLIVLLCLKGNLRDGENRVDGEPIDADGVPLSADEIGGDFDQFF